MTPPPDDKGIEAKTKIEWQCTGYRPTRWMLGDRVENRIVNRRASVVRRDNGDWEWDCFNADQYRHGKQPSREMAMDAAEKELARMTQS